MTIHWDSDIAAMNLSDVEKNGLQVFRNYQAAFDSHAVKQFAKIVDAESFDTSNLEMVLELIGNDDFRLIPIIACAFADDLLKSAFEPRKHRRRRNQRRSKGKPMFRVTLVCGRVPTSAGRRAASNIQREFAEYRQHHRNVVCSFANGELVLTAENDFDPDGLALMDEFSDCISAYIAESFDGDIRLINATTI